MTTEPSYFSKKFSRNILIRGCVTLTFLFVCLFFLFFCFVLFCFVLFFPIFAFLFLKIGFNYILLIELLYYTQRSLNLSSLFSLLMKSGSFY